MAQDVYGKYKCLLSNSKTALKSTVIIWGGGEQGRGLELDWMQETSEEHLTVAQVSKTEDLDQGSVGGARRKG